MQYILRYGAMRRLGIFGSNREKELARGTRVIARTDRGLEVGEILSEATEAAIAHLDDPVKGPILRVMSAEDENEIFRLRSQERIEWDKCREQVTQHGLDLKLIDVEHIFGGERIIIYYLAEGRIDFRELVRALAAEFQTRIEMRQIGVRDEAKLLADYGDCGKPVCCNTHLSEMPPVSMKMAKLQKATLDPTKISGRCGRLKCCLRYEYDTYEELKKDLPPIGSDVVTNQGRAQVLAQEILAGQLMVQTEDSRRILIDASDVLTVLSRGKGRKRKPAKKQPAVQENPGKEPTKTKRKKKETTRKDDNKDGANPDKPE
ncbi:MAG: signal peptidase [Pirellulales bacterium]|nr:signal peptidase [Pirellulales bacterium]